MDGKELTKELVVKYINHTCTVEELKMFLAIMRERTGTFDEFDDAAREYWLREPVEDVDSRAYEIYRKEALKLIGKGKSRTRRVHAGRAVAVAATVVIVLTGGFFTTRQVVRDRIERQLASYETMATAPGEIREITLPDGTAVTLNVASTLKYNARYGKETRDVWLDGEAFFDVTADAGCPFRIHARELDVTVKGTSFNVKAYPDDYWNSVTVRSGKVGVSYGNDDIIMNLLPDEEIVISTSGSSASKHSVNTEKSLSWMKGSLVFRQQSLPEVVRMLRRYYSCDIELEDTTSKARLSGTHDNKSIESVLESICFSAGLHYRQENGKYIIY